MHFCSKVFNFFIFPFLTSVSSSSILIFLVINHLQHVHLFYKI